MITPVRLLPVAIAAIALTRPVMGQQPRTVTVTEPGVYELADLFKAADKVAVVKVLSGDTENYQTAVYKGEVVQNFKGATVGETVYFGPYVGLRLGWEYVLFLRMAPEIVSPKNASSTGFGRVRVERIFNEGYSSMETKYECVFDGEEISQKCDYGVRICTDYIRLPKSTPVFPPETEDTPFGCRWVRRGTFISLLEKISREQKANAN